jgi:hypothetical protein
MTTNIAGRLVQIVRLVANPKKLAGVRGIETPPMSEPEGVLAAAGRPNRGRLGGAGKGPDAKQLRALLTPGSAYLPAAYPILPTDAVPPVVPLAR